MESLPTEEFGDLKLTMMECEKIASADLKGSHFIHFIAHDRTVHSQSFEPPRLCRRPQLLRGWGYDEQDDKQVLA